MIEQGLVEEVKRFVHLKEHNSLNTVGYKELFAHFDGECTLEFAIEKIKQNSRIYSRKQMTWFRRDEDIRWFHPDEQDAIVDYLNENCI
jgi:tRNA dimethylallyltransferase